jgi:starvation-inducible DNA-binding protein
VQGSGFFTLHAKLEELYEQTAEILDEVAERILALGGSPVASMEKALTLTKVKELEDAPISTKDTLKYLINDVEYWINDSKEIVKLAEEAEDGPTADMFTGYLSEYQKLLWMLKANLG